MSAISSKKSVHADNAGCICNRRCQVTIAHSNTKESKERKKAILTSKTWYAVKDVKVRPENLYNDDDDSFVSRRSLSPSANLNRSLISRLTARRRVGEELHTCNTGSLGTCKATACVASQAASGASTRDERRRRALDDNRSALVPFCKWFWRVLEKALGFAHKGLGGRHFFLYRCEFDFELLLLPASELSGCREALGARMLVQLIQIAGG